MKEKLRNASAVFILIGIFIVLFFSSRFFVIVDAGTVGVISTFGKVSENAYDPGFHLKNPFSNIIEMSTRTLSYTMSGTPSEGEIQGDDSIQALAKDGGQVWFDVTVLYKLQSEAASGVYSDLGTAYQEKLIRPQIRSTIREVAALYPVTELYSGKREAAQQEMLTRMTESIEPRGITVEDVLLRKVNISEQLSASIEAKLSAQQEVQRQEFEIQKAEKEAERKVAEAKGQRDAQDIINQSLTPNYLYFLYINELKDREGTIYVPVDPQSGLPLFKGVE